MTIEDIVRGESKNVEFKVMLPGDSEKYTKTIVAFANTQGGQLIVGVDNDTREVVGVGNDIVFKVMDSIANAVSDSCTPQIVPDITFQTIDGKTLVVVSVTPGANRPYYLKSKGKEKGTYVRVAGTSRLADEEKIRELEYEGERISWDELTCVGYDVTESAIKKLCHDMNRYRKEMQERRESSEKLPQVTRSQLLNWNVIKKSEDGYLASNAFALLTGKHFHYSRTQCAVFAGTERGEFIDKQEYSGPLYKQIEEAYAFVLRNIRRSAKVEGLVRREKHELPPAAIREMIINAHCHRNFLDPSCVQVALYDDRLEITSPGGLCYGLTLEEAVSGRSKQRNRVIAEVFNQMGLIEAWGTGLRNIRRAAKEYRLPEPEFIEMTGTFRVNFYREQRNIAETSMQYQSNGDTVLEHRSIVSEPSVMEWYHVGEVSLEHQRDIAEISERHWRDIRQSSEKYVRNIEEVPEKYGRSIEEATREYESNFKEASEKHRRTIGEASEKYGRDNGEPLENHQNLRKMELNSTQRKILELLSEDVRLSAVILAKQIGISSRNIESNIKKLKEHGILVRHGSPKSGYWEIVMQ